MTLDGFLTVLALLAALYAVLTPVQRHHLSLSRNLQLLAAVPACAAILAFELFDLTPPPCPAVLGEACDVLVLGTGEPGPARKFAFLIAAFWLGAAVLIHRYRRPTLGSVPALAGLASELLVDERFDEAIKLVEPNLALLSRASQRDFRRQRVRDWLEAFGPVDEHSFAALSRGPGPHPWRGENVPAPVARLVRGLAPLIPLSRRSEEAASDLLHRLFTSEPLLDHVVGSRPSFGVALCACRAYGSADYSDRYLTRLIAIPGSLLYQELATNDVSEGRIGYAFPVRNRLLHFLFADPSNAERLGAWTPIGQYGQRLLEGAERPGYIAYLNGDASWFDRERASDPLWSAMFFFDLMVTSAARHGLTYHMWLYFLEHFAAGLERIYDSSGLGIDRDAEFPTRAARLLYELVQFLTSWIGLYKWLPVDSPLRIMPDRPGRGVTIPHAAARALGQVIALVMASERIDDDVIQYLHDIALAALKDLHDDEQTGAMRRFVIEALLAGNERPGQLQHLRRLHERFGRADDYLQYELKDFEEALAERLAKEPVRIKMRRSPF